MCNFINYVSEDMHKNLKNSMNSLKTCILKIFPSVLVKETEL